jgi:Tol biopolymer transport system component
MSEPTQSGSPSPVRPVEDRLDSWKEIAAYLKRDVTTVQRWEKREGMPVHRHLHDKMGSVSALRTELDAWTRRRTAAIATESPARIPSEIAPSPATMSTSLIRRAWNPLWAVVVVGALVATTIVWRLEQGELFWTNPIVAAKFVNVTDFDGAEQAAAISRDGRFIAFLSDRAGPVDVWMTQIGTGQFYNLTQGIGRELVNPSVRTLGFSPDGAFVTFWTRKPDAAAAVDISVWAVPLLGGPPRPYLEGVAEFGWSSDAARLVYHTPGPGDPMFVRDVQQSPESRQIFAAPAGLHSHFLVWSNDQAFIYFVQGALPDHMDIWRIAPTGGAPERITSHQSRVSHPVFVNPRTLVYLASDSSGVGPWLYSMDVERRIPHRVSSGIDTYTSLAASADGRRLVTTLATTKPTLWRALNTGGAVDINAPDRIPLSTRGGSSPRLGDGYLLYVSSQDATDTIWKQRGDQAATELWTAPAGRILGGPAIEPGGGRIAFSVRQGAKASLYVMNADGTQATVVDKSLDWQGAPAWAPDGRSLTAAALDDGVPHLFRVSFEGRPPAAIGRELALDPVWSPDGRFLVFSGADIGTTFQVKAMAAEGGAYHVPKLTLSRGARRMRFLPASSVLLVLKGNIRHKNVWQIDLETGLSVSSPTLPQTSKPGTSTSLQTAASSCSSERRRIRR